MSLPRKVLIISAAGDLAISDLAAELLSYGYEMVSVASIEEAQEQLRVQGLPHLIVIDLSGLEVNGLEFAQQVFEKAGMPIIIVAGASADTADAIRAMQFADDFIRREFANTQELALRIRRVLSRIQNFGYASGPEVQIADGISVDHLNLQLKVQGETRKLTPTENALLTALLEKRGQVVEAESLIERVWRLDPSVKDRNALRVHLHRLRQKMEPDPDNPELIATVRGIGYSLIDPA